MSQGESQFSQFSHLVDKIESCLHNSLKSAKNLLDHDTIENIRVKIQQISNSDSLVELIGYFLYALISKIQHIKQSIHVNADREDYQNLQNAVQKAEAEIRKHIRLQQQLKIYMDGLEEKIQQLERDLETESRKYLQLFESTKVMDAEKRELKKKLKSYQIKLKSSQEKQMKTLSHKTSKILSEPASIYQGQTNPYRMYNEKSRITRGKNFVDKSQEHKILHISHGGQLKVQNSRKKGLDGQIDVSLGQSHKNQTQKTQLKQMTRTIQLRQNAKKHSRKLIKYSTEQRSLVHNRRDARSNSVCH